MGSTSPAWARAHLLLPAIAAASIAIAHAPLAGPVIDRGGDNADHLLSEYALVDAIAQGDDPLGPIGVDFGAPLLRFYQGLFYLTVAGSHLVAGLDVRTAHNALVALCFSLSPFALCWCLRRIGLPRFAAGLGSLAAAASVGGFASSFEAYHGLGIATQSMGALFLPLFLGAFAGMLRRENGVAATALLFAAAFLSHAAMAITALLAGALYALVVPCNLRANLVRLVALAALAGALVAFWALPFAEHTRAMRAVPDSVFRGDEKAWWFTSVTDDEMVRLAATGRLLDDGRRRLGPDPLDDVLAKVSCLETSRWRPPVMSVLAGLGLAVALLRIRRGGERFLAAGLAFSLMLFAGPDDHPWLARLPFAAHLQVARFTYLVELFAYGLVGVGAEALLGAGLRAARRARGGAAPALLAAWGTAAAAAIAAVPVEIALLGERFARVQDPAEIDETLRAARAIPEAGYPHRLYSAERWNVFMDWLASDGFRPICTHWFGVGPSAALDLCEALRRDPAGADLHALAGVRWVVGRGERAERFSKATDPAGRPLWTPVPAAAGRGGAGGGAVRVFDSGRGELLTARRGGAVAVVCDDAQWILLVRSWLARFGGRAGSDGTPLPLRLAPGALDGSRALAAARIAVYAAAPDARDLAALSDLARRGGAVLSTRALPGVLSARVGIGVDLWERIEALARGSGSAGGGEVRVAFARGDGRRSNQRFAFDVESAGPFVGVLPTQAAPGWRATADGVALEVFPAGPDLVGALVPGGARRLLFEWEMPGRHRLALLASAAALLLALALLGAGRLARRRR